MDIFFGPQTPMLGRVLLSLLFVLGMMALAFQLMRRFAPQLASRINPLQAFENTRLGVIDTFAVDPRRRLLLIKRDGVEHLIMVGGPNDILIETGIKREKTGPSRMSTERPSDRAPWTKPVTAPFPQDDTPHDLINEGEGADIMRPLSNKEDVTNAPETKDKSALEELRTLLGRKPTS